MALVACPECSHQVSTLAASCPQCGRPISPPVLQPAAAQQQPITIEQTSKSIKLRMAICAGSFWIGWVMLFTGEPQAAAWMILLGGIGYLYFKLARWWENG